MRKLLYLLIILTPVAAFGLRAAAPPSRGGIPSTHELVVLHPHRAYRVRLHIQLKGGGYEDGWNRLVEGLYRFLDIDGDGMLSKAEASHAPSRDQWQQMSLGTATVEPDAAPDFKALVRGKDGATLEDLKSWYRASTAGPFQVGWGWRGMPSGPVSDALWRHLDTNRDGRLSRAELEAAPRVLARLDTNEDELISQSEIMNISQGGYYEQPPTFRRGPAHGLAFGGLPFFSRRLDEPVEPLVGVLLAKYAKGGAKTLGPNDFRIDRATFERLDGNKDGRLDAGELARWADLPADVEVRVPLNADTKLGVSVLTVSGDDVRTRQEAGRLQLVLGGWWLELNGALLPPTPARRAEARQASFRGLDMDNNGYLDSGELYRPPFQHVALLRLADRDGDGKITEKEFTSFADLRSRLQGGITFLRVEDRGRSLFRLLDRNGDGQFGIRERRDVARHLGPLLRAPRGLERNDLPQEYRIMLAHGQAPADFDGGPDMRPRPRPAPPSRGPMWFRKMDRNNDGDVSRAEWLGTAEQFRKIDIDGDGLIGPEEAWAADAWFRKPVR